MSADNADSVVEEESVAGLAASPAGGRFVPRRGSPSEVLEEEEGALSPPARADPLLRTLGAETVGYSEDFESIAESLGAPSPDQRPRAAVFAPVRVAPVATDGSGDSSSHELSVRSDELEAELGRLRSTVQQRQRQLRVLRQQQRQREIEAMAAQVAEAEAKIRDLEEALRQPAPAPVPAAPPRASSPSRRYPVAAPARAAAAALEPSESLVHEDSALGATTLGGETSIPVSIGWLDLVSLVCPTARSTLASLALEQEEEVEEAGAVATAAEEEEEEEFESYSSVSVLDAFEPQGDDRSARPQQQVAPPPVAVYPTAATVAQQGMIRLEDGLDSSDDSKLREIDRLEIKVGERTGSCRTVLCRDVTC